MPVNPDDQRGKAADNSVRRLRDPVAPVLSDDGRIGPDVLLQPGTFLLWVQLVIEKLSQEDATDPTNLLLLLRSEQI